MKVNALYLCIGIILFYPAILPWEISYAVYLCVDIYMLYYVLKKCRMKKLFSLTFVLCAFMIIFNTYNFLDNWKIGNLILGTFYFIFIYCLDRSLYVLYCENRIFDLLIYLKKYSFVLNVISGISVLILWNQRNLSSTCYLLGDKFVSSYLLLLGIIIYTVCENKMKSINLMKLIPMLFYSILFDWAVGCMTAVVMSFFILINSIFLLLKNKKIVGNSVFILGSVIAASLFPVWNVYVLKNRYVNNIIVNILHKNIGLSGRILIYDSSWNIMKKRLLTGYGYSSRIIADYLKVGNIQNGLLSIVVQYGLICACLLSLIIVVCLRNSQEKRNISWWLFFLLAYSFIAASTVEVTYDGIIFIFVIFITNVLKNQKI